MLEGRISATHCREVRAEELLGDSAESESAKQIFHLSLVSLEGGEAVRVPLAVCSGVGQAGWGLERPALVEDIPAQGRGVK